MGHSAVGGPQLRNDNFAQEPEEELIPTAIVIKNIPFAVKKESLVDIMTHMNLPLPYAFNYHFDNGVFRGLAFANFTSADETSTVINHLNHYEIQGRKLRVEYKKMLPAQERERIEREKRERRGQLEEQHRPQGTPGLHNQQSMSSLSSHIPATSPSPVSARNSGKGKISFNSFVSLLKEIEFYDLNDPQTLGFYTQLAIFKQNEEQESLIFPSSLSPAQRRIIHTLAHHMQLSHDSKGNGDLRRIHVLRPAPENNISPPIPSIPTLHSDPSRRVLNRSATTDFSEARSSDPAMFGITLRGQHSTGYLGIPDSPGGFGPQPNLRGAKSYADLRSYTPSPVPSTASFPAALQSNIARFTDIGQGAVASGTPTLTPTASGGTLGQSREEALMFNGFGNMNLNNSVAPTINTARLRGMMTWEENQSPQTAPIGSNRGINMTNYDDSLRDRRDNLPMRQPRGPVGERTTGFSRSRQNGHQGRGSDELRHQSSNVEIIVE